MPKIVDHDQRRLELVDATWRIIARLGMEGATMREIAEEAGFANGALKPYFPTKDLLLTSAFGHVFNRTNQRIATMTEGLSGVAALRAFCAEVLPLDEERVHEARIVIPFWQKALNDAGMATLHSESMSQWHNTITAHCAAARAAGEINARIGDAAVADHLLNMMLGAQIVVALSPAEHFSQDLAGQLDDYLALLAG